jgi:uncharacterized protein with beta-barrel porin domain
MEAEGGWIDPAAGDGSHFRASSGGLAGGADVEVGSGARLGGALDYESASLSDSNGGSANQSTFRASLYASQTFGTVGLSGALSYAHGWGDTSRATGINLATASRSGDEITGAVQLADPFSAGDVRFTPAAGVLISYVSSGAFRESDPADPAFAISGPSSHTTVVSPYVTVGVSREFTTSSGLKLTPDAEIGYRYDGVAGGFAQTLIASDGTAFFGNQVKLDQSSALIGVSLTAHQGQWTGFVKYRASVAGDWNDQSIQAGVRVAF